MRIALYYPWVYLTSGVERMMLELARRSRHEWTIFTSRYYPEQTYPELKSMNIVELAPVSVNRKYSAVGNAAATIIRQKIDLADYDALVVSSEGLGDLINFRNHGLPVICYCHTPMKVIHDRFTRERYMSGHRLMAPAFHFFSGVFKLVDKAAWKYYTHIFCNSNEVRERILRAGLAPAEKIEVLHPGLDTTMMTRGDNFEAYFLVAGRVKWFKNIELAIDSFRLFKSRHPEFSRFKLRVAGRVEPRSEEYLSRLRAQSAGEDVEFIRNPSDEELLSLYSNCYALVFPSLNEDWGMVPLEAMGFGKPVLSINRGGPTESVIDGQTGFLLEAEPAAFSDAMAKLASDEQFTRQLGRNAANHVRQFDWRFFVSRFDEYLDTI